LLVKLQDIKIGNRFRKDLGDIAFLAKNIQKNGLLHPIVITKENELICGRRRIEAYRNLGLTEIESSLMSLQVETNEAEIDENNVRKSFTIEEISQIDEFYREKEEAAAKERQRSGRPLGNFPEGRSREKIAKRVGVSDRTLEKIRVLREAAIKNSTTYGPFWDKANSKNVNRQGV
jgi:ParB family chromosome partitioning protein